MYTFLKSQFTSLIATLIDFCVTIVAIELFNISYGVASGTGNTAGAITSFFLNRKWAFEGNQKGNWWHQAAKYFFVWCGYFGLNVLLVTGLTTYTSIHYIIIKIVVAITLSVGYNYSLYKRYVFK